MSMISTDTALRAAANILRDSAECGRMPSGETLPFDAAELHREAAGHLEAMRASAASSGQAEDGRTVQLACMLTDAEAWNLAQFLKRVGFSDFRTNAQDDDEAYAMRNAADRVAIALKEVGYAPR